MESYSSWRRNPGILWLSEWGASVIDPNGDGSQVIKSGLRLGRTAMEESGKLTKSKDVSSETKKD